MAGKLIEGIELRVQPELGSLHALNVSAAPLGYGFLLDLRHGREPTVWRLAKVENRCAVWLNGHIIRHVGEGDFGNFRDDAVCGDFKPGGLSPG